MKSADRFDEEISEPWYSAEFLLFSSACYFSVKMAYFEDFV